MSPLLRIYMLTGISGILGMAALQDGCKNVNNFYGISAIVLVTLTGIYGCYLDLKSIKND